MSAVITLNCSSAGTCANIKESDNNTAICSEVAGVCTCGSYTDATGTPTNTACTKDNLKCSDLGQDACTISSICTFNTACVCDTSKHFVDKNGEC